MANIEETELASLEIPEYALILAEVSWRRYYGDDPFVVTSIDGLRGLCDKQGYWVKNIAINRKVAQNFSMLTTKIADRKIVNNAISRWPVSDANTYAVFNPKDLPNAFQTISASEEHRASAIRGSSKAITQGS